MSSREEWLLMRKTYLGGSDMAAICGVPSFKKTALDGLCSEAVLN
jgi:predicted phage-related endonuclease